ncbi:MFS transporter [Arthrobacter sp. zg-ZUI100]|uniref:MFS transporter n=1 Tax=Arthrobacter jiangjiafuii TaxID=2817475 RepID=UPI001AEDB0F0|nr:MFS transporter [Arthrobacter jiangjiafuii]MBP3037481.1 MFS transporter [Arthrobacter jiangjiafuii]
MASLPNAGEEPDQRDDRRRVREKLWTSSYLLAMAVQLGASLVFVTLMTYMALYSMQAFGARDSAAGFAASSFILGSAVARIFIGKYVDFIGRKRLAVIALVVFVVCSAIYPVAGSYSGLIALRIVHGGAFGAISTAITSAVVSMVPPARRGEGMGFFLAGSTIAMAVGPLLAVQLANNLGPQWVFLLTGAASVLALAAATIVKLPERRPGQQEYERKYRLRATDILDPNALPVSLVVLLCAFGYAGIVTYLNPFLVERGMSTAASLFFVVFAAGMLAIRLVSGRRQDRRGDNSVIIPLTILFALSLVLLGLATETWHLVVAGTLAGLGYGGLLPSLQVVAVTRAPSARMSIGMTTHYLMLDAGVALGPVLFGFLIPLAGYQGLYLALAGTVLAAVVLYWFVHGRRVTNT